MKSVLYPLGPDILSGSDDGNWWYLVLICTNLRVIFHMDLRSSSYWYEEICKDEGNCGASERCGRHG